MRLDEAYRAAVGGLKDLCHLIRIAPVVNRLYPSGFHFLPFAVDGPKNACLRENRYVLVDNMLTVQPQSEHGPQASLYPCICTCKLSVLKNRRYRRRHLVSIADAVADHLPVENLHGIRLQHNA